MAIVSTHTIEQLKPANWPVWLVQVATLLDAGESEGPGGAQWPPGVDCRGPESFATDLIRVVTARSFDEELALQLMIIGILRDPGNKWCSNVADVYSLLVVGEDIRFCTDQAENLWRQIRTGTVLGPADLIAQMAAQFLVEKNSDYPWRLIVEASSLASDPHHRRAIQTHLRLNLIKAIERAGCYAI